jgi:hypothetical protein
MYCVPGSVLNAGDMSEKGAEPDLLAWCSAGEIDKEHRGFSVREPVAGYLLTTSRVLVAIGW